MHFIPCPLQSDIELIVRTIGVAASICVAVSASAQQVDVPRRVGDPQILAVNVLLGGLTAASWRAATHRPIWRGFARGAAAGAGVYVGKKLIGSGKPAGWWTGRQVAALASSEVVNAAKTLPFLETAVMPLGPIRIHINRAKRSVSPRLDLLASVSTIVIATRSDSRFAWRESLSTGVPVFLRPEVSNQVGNYAAGVVSLSELVPDGKFPPLETKRVVISHEMVHAAQYDFFFTVWSDPVQQAIARKLSVAGGISRFVDVNLLLPVELAGNTAIDYKNRPWEIESLSLTKHE